MRSKFFFVHWNAALGFEEWEYRSAAFLFEIERRALRRPKASFGVKTRLSLFPLAKLGEPPLHS